MEYVLGCRTAHEAWTNLVDIYASVLKSRVNHLKKELHTIQKGTDSIDKYLLRLKAIREQLTVAGEYVSDIMIGGLAGLPKEYAVIRTVVQARESSITMKEFRAQLIGAEKEIEGEMNVLSQNMSAMFVQGSTSNSNAASSSNPQIKCPMSGKVIAEVAFIGNNVILYFTMFEEIRLLGFGAFATVALCRHKVDGSDYAVKKIPIGRYVSFDYERVRREVDYMSKLNHANIVRYMTSFVDGIFPGERSLESTLAKTDISEEDINHDQCPCLCIVQEVCDGTLGDYIASGRLNSLCVPKRLQILKQITEGLAYLHTRDIVHGDLKADNIFVLDDVWKAGDFGLAYKGAHVQGYRNDLYHLGLIFGEVMLVTDNSVEEHSQNLFMLESLGGVSKLFRPGVFRGILEKLFGSSGGPHTADSILSCFGGLMKLALAGESI